ncbi:MAG: crossover junction endodeoxyribonuclease RuvC [Gemmataceae bacterium]
MDAQDLPKRSSNSQTPTVLDPEPQPYRVLGVDPGLRITGYGVIERSDDKPLVREAGIIRSADGRSTADMAERLKSLYTSLVEVVEQFSPKVMAVEQLYAHYKHPRTAILMGHARGVLLLAGAQHNVPIVSYSATQIKKRITGNGRASKEQVQLTIQRELSLTKVPEPPDVADALAAALCQFYEQKIHA